MVDGVEVAVAGPKGVICFPARILKMGKRENISFQLKGSSYSVFRKRRALHAGGDGQIVIKIK